MVARVPGGRKDGKMSRKEGRREGRIEGKKEGKKGTKEGKMDIKLPIPPCGSHAHFCPPLRTTSCSLLPTPSIHKQQAGGRNGLGGG